VIHVGMQQDAERSHKRRGHRRRKLRAALPRLSKFFLEHLLLLPLGAVIALVWVNVEPESYYSFSLWSAFAVNEIAMAIFFAVIMKEVVEAIAPGGVLHPWRRVALAVVVAVGAAAVPALLHSAIVEALDEPMLDDVGWPITFGADLAVMYFFARLIFRRHPMVPLLMLLGIASNAAGFVVLAFLYPTREPQAIIGFLSLVIGVAVALLLRYRRVRSFWPYLIGVGGLFWYGFFRLGMHPALALVPMMPFLPHAPRDPGFFVDPKPDAKDTLNKFEWWWRHPAQVALFFFGLVNAGVPVGALEPGTWGLPIAFVVGKPIGVLLGTGVALLVGLHLPKRVHWRELAVGGFLAALGFTVGLFFCAAIVPPGQLRSQLNMGVIVSLAGGPIALLMARLLGVGRFAPHEPAPSAPPHPAA
jgi:NhaA family Na+:H+ antiporter